MTDLQQMIRKRREGAAVRRGWLALLGRTAAFALVLYLLATQVFLVTQLSGSGMFPALKDGDLLIAYRLQPTWAKNDVVFYRRGEELCVGRIIARGSDVVSMSESGTLIVNGTVQAGEILYPTLPREGGLEYPYVVPHGEVFVLGDHRTDCTDSRDFGSIPESSLEAKLITVLRRRGL